ncbi:PglL family O-oligosaccharyltransferase [Rhodoferax sp. BLA1]|uniref:PglL family O-oligosaccharyltransferase n=1 Tax=Rhodoferax sp. BLA1 TaxID=2576062 RepID=UPI0015D2656C|nr:O-antigen ligase family protein [Rhodoferax sp. BLA1]
MKSNQFSLLSVLASILLCLAWLLPNHYLPWSAFHSEAWAATWFALLSLFSINLSKNKVDWPFLSLVGFVSTGIVWLQFSAGLLPFVQQAWMSSVYLIGFGLAVAVGYRWEKYHSEVLLKILLLTFALASVLSVWLQWNTWLQLLDDGITDIWSMGLSSNRPYANVGQPNNLATLLLWGLLACLWAVNARYIRGSVAVLIAAFLLTGLALTQSRSGLLGATALVTAVWWWRHLWVTSRLPYVVSLLYGYLWCLPSALQLLYKSLGLGGEDGFLRLAQQGELRFSAWSLFAHAAFERPWFGYGFTEVERAQLDVADKFASLTGIFGHTHNLFLDLVIRFGIPIGILLSGLLACWLVRAFLNVKNATTAIMVMLVGVASIHAMFEYPLNYAYFLLPTGVLIGSISVYLPNSQILSSSRWLFLVFSLSASILLGVIISDYFKVEESYYNWRFKNAGIGLEKIPKDFVPNVLVLNYFQEWIKLSQLDFDQTLSADDLNRLRKVVGIKPTADGLYMLAVALARNKQQDEASTILSKICKITDQTKCDILKKAWAAETRNKKYEITLKWPPESNFQTN